jgi:nucleoid DNA-binding protein
MNTEELAAEIAEKTRLDVTLVRRVIVAAAADAVAEAAAGRVVHWPWFGRFERVQCAARRVRSAKTGQLMTIKAQGRLRFFPSVHFKRAVAPRRVLP